MTGIIGRGLRGAGSGLAGTGVEALLTEAENRLRGRRAVYDPSNLARRLARRYFGVRLSGDTARRLGHVMRWSYGPSWGLLLAAVAGTRERDRLWPLWGLGLGATVLGFELLLLPATGATPPVSSWRGDELKLELLNTTAFGLAAAAVLRVVSAPGGPVPVSRSRPESPAAG